MTHHDLEHQIDQIENFRAQMDQLGITGDLDQIAQQLEEAPKPFRHVLDLLDMVPQTACDEFSRILATQPELLLAGVFLGYFQGVHDGRALHEQLGGTK